MRAVVYTGAGGNEVVRLEERPDPVPGSNDVLVRVTYAGLNPADVVQREGRYPAPAGSPPDIPGLEVAGTVERCGDHVLAWQPGDRVFGLVGGGGLADRVVVHERCLTRVPDSLDEQAAAATVETFVTAHDAAFTQAGLRPGRDAARARRRRRRRHGRRPARGHRRRARPGDGTERRGGRAACASSGESR